MPFHPNPDKCQRLIHLMGFSVGETSWRRPDGSGYWQVDASDGEHTILATGDTQRQAWQLACRMVGRVVCEA